MGQSQTSFTVSDKYKFSKMNLEASITRAVREVLQLVIVFSRGQRPQATSTAANVFSDSTQVAQ